MKHFLQIAPTAEQTKFKSTGWLALIGCEYHARWEWWWSICESTARSHRQTLSSYSLKFMVGPKPENWVINTNLSSLPIFAQMPKPFHIIFILKRTECYSRSCGNQHTQRRGIFACTHCFLSPAWQSTMNLHQYFRIDQDYKLPRIRYSLWI